MKVKVKHLKKLIEAALLTTDAEGAGYALAKYKQMMLTSYILYDPSKLEHDSENVVVAAIQLKDNIRGHYNAKEVIMSVAKKGWGPFIYSVAMQNEGGLVPDRISVSPKAKHVWDHYYNNPSVKHKLLDDEHNPKTKPTKDDTTRLHLGDEHNTLNYAYFSSHTIDISKLTQKHNKIESKNKNLRNELFKLMLVFFDNSYRN